MVQLYCRLSPEFVQAALKAAPTPSAGRLQLLDPFSGCGTAPLAARLFGASAIAYEPHPFFAVISDAKANSPRYWADLSCISAALARGISAGNSENIPLPAAVSAFLCKLFRPQDISALLSTRRELENAGLASHPLAILILSRILDHCCLAATDGIYKAPTSTKTALSPQIALQKVVKTILQDRHDAVYSGGEVIIYNKSSENMNEINDRSIDLAVTSPPYLNNFDFAEMTRMYLYFWGFASSWREITVRVRRRLIVNTTTALATHREQQPHYRSTLSAAILRDADTIVSALSDRRRERAGKKDYNLLVYPYLSQMQTILRETHRVLKRGAPFHMVISDAALYGIHIPTPQWLACIMAECGFIDVQCNMLRRRGHRWVLDKRNGSPLGLGEYYVFGRVH